MAVIILDNHWYSTIILPIRDSGTLIFIGIVNSNLYLKTITLLVVSRIWMINEWVIFVGDVGLTNIIIQFYDHY